MKRFLPATIFGLAFGFLEAIVVVYLRAIYYPEGFSFPLRLMNPEFLIIEITREFSTIVMLSVVGWILGNTLFEKFHFFIFVFAMWDIFYYIGLKIFLNWPESLFTWDVLFLIPITWIGPVLAPLICSIVMIIISLISIYFSSKNYMLKFTLLSKITISVGIGMILYTFIYDYSKILFENKFYEKLNSLTTDEAFWGLVSSYIPQKFNWIIFFFGCILISLSYILILYSVWKSKITTDNSLS